MVTRKFSEKKLLEDAAERAFAEPDQCISEYQSNSIPFFGGHIKIRDTTNRDAAGNE